MIIYPSDAVKLFLTKLWPESFYLDMVSQNLLVTGFTTQHFKSLVTLLRCATEKFLPTPKSLERLFDFVNGLVTNFAQFLVTVVTKHKKNSFMLVNGMSLNDNSFSRSNQYNQYTLKPPKLSCSILNVGLTLTMSGAKSRHESIWQ